MADHPSECPVCNSVAIVVEKEQCNYQHETRVHTASFESQHVSTTFHVRCHDCDNQWTYTAPACAGWMLKVLIPDTSAIVPVVQPAN